MQNRAGRLAGPVIGVLLGVSLTGCGVFASDEGDSDQVRVVAGFYPLEYVAERVGGEHASVESLTKPGQEPHDTELTVAQTAAVLDADLVLYARGFQPAVDEVAADAADGQVMDALSVLASRDPEIDGARPFELLEGDPHVWLDPRAMATLAVEVEDLLTQIDPEHATDFRDNTADLVADLARLDGRFAAGLEECERRVVVTSHDAFGYLGQRYDLELHSVAGLSPDAEPSPARLADLADLIREDGITTVFSERIAAPELAGTLSEELDLDTAVLDPIEGLTDDTSDEDYLSLMEANLAALRKANRCR